MAVHVAFQSLPTEIVHLVLELVPLSSLLSCLLVSKHLHRIISMSSRLQYTLHLSKSRLIEAPLPSAVEHLSYASRLAIHRQREKAWRTMTYSSRQNIPLVRGAVYDLKNNLYAHGSEDDTGRTSSITFYDLPHAQYSKVHPKIQNDEGGESGEGIKSWSHLTGDLHLRDFTVDPSQDLLVLVTIPPAGSNSLFEIHLRTLSTNVPHPLAMSTVLPCLPRQTFNPMVGVNMGFNQGNVPQQAMTVLNGLIQTINQMLNNAGLPHIQFPANVAGAGGAQGAAPPPAPHQQPAGGPAQNYNPQPPAAAAGPAPPQAAAGPPIPPPAIFVGLGGPPFGIGAPPPAFGGLGGGLGLLQPFGNVRIQLLDDLIALMVPMPFGGTHFIIWDWKKGETVAGCAATFLAGRDDVTLLAPNAFLTATPSGCFELYKFEMIPSDEPKSPLRFGPLPYFASRDAPSPPQLDMWKVTYPKLVAKYKLPELNPGWIFSNLALSSNPVMAKPPTNPDGSLTLSDVLDHVRNNSSIDSQMSDNPGSFIYSQSQSSELDDNLDTQRPLPIDMKLTHPSPKSRILACGLFLMRHRSISLNFGIGVNGGVMGPLQFGPPPLPAHHAGPAPPPPAPAPVPHIPVLHPPPAPANAAGNPPAPAQPPPLPHFHIGLPPLHDQPDEDEDEDEAEPRPVRPSFVFFADLGTFLRDLQRSENEFNESASPPTTGDEEEEAEDARFFSAQIPLDLMTPVPRYPVPTASLPRDSPELKNRLIRERRRNKFRAMTGYLDVKEVDWKEWGPEGTRWFNEERMGQDWQHAVWGMKCVECIDADKVTGRKYKRKSPTEEDESGEVGASSSARSVGAQAEAELPTVEELLGLPSRKRKVLVLRDFNPYSCFNPNFYLDGAASAPSSVSDSEDGKCKAPEASGSSIPSMAPVRRKIKWANPPKLVTEPTTLASFGAFKEKIVSAMPYTEVFSEEDFDATTAMIDDEHLLLLQRGTEGDVSGLEILTF